MAKAWTPLCGLVFAGDEDSIEALTNLEKTVGVGRLTVNQLRFFEGLVLEDLRRRLRGFEIRLGIYWGLQFIQVLSPPLLFF